MLNDEKQDEKPKPTVEDVRRRLGWEAPGSLLLFEDGQALLDAHDREKARADDLQSKLGAVHASLDDATRELLELRAKNANGHAHDVAGVLREKRRERDERAGEGKPALRPAQG